MKLRKVTWSVNDTYCWIEPLENHQIFYHCSDGAIRVKESEFEKIVAPLLLIHGVEFFQFVD